MFVFSDFVTFTKLHVLLLWLKFNRYTQIALSAVWYVGIAVVKYSLSIILQQNNFKSCLHFVALRNTSFTQQGQFNKNVKTSASISTNKAQRRFATKRQKTLPCKRLFHFSIYLICFNTFVHRFYLLLTMLSNHALHAFCFFEQAKKFSAKQIFIVGML